MSSSAVDPNASTGIDDILWAERCNVLYRTWVQIRYHRRRQRFFDLLDKATKSLTILLSAALIGEAMRRNLPYVASSISVLSLLALVFGYGDRKQVHKELAEMAADLAAEVVRVPGAEITAAIVSIWSSEYLRICAKAPPPLKSLTIICEREQSAADGHPDHIPEPGLIRRWLCHVV